MPFKSYDRHLAYNRDRHKRIRLAAIAALGGKCAACGETNTDELEFDHIDPATKTIKMTTAFKLSYTKMCQELAKCQLLCLACHLVKDGRLVRDKWGEFKREGKTSRVRQQEDWEEHPV